MADEKWMIRGKKADFRAIGEEFSIDPVTARVLVNRGITEREAIRKFLRGNEEDYYPPEKLLGLSDAAGLLYRRVREQSRIRIIGDYDIDGVCSTYILYRAISLAGGKADYAIPHRITDGYGLNERLVDKAYEDGIGTIITCDNGISAGAAIRKAKDYGMTVILTDHHEIPEGEDGQILPPADVVVDPKQAGDTYPWPHICGAVVAWKLVKVFFGLAGIPLREWEKLKVFAAIATVGDVMPLLDENRILVREGLKAIGQTENIGLRELVRANNLDPARITAFQVGFVLGPCINAAGRLESADTALELFLAEDRETAEKLALHLKDLNEKRKSMTEEGVEAARKLVEEEYSSDRVLVIYLPGCHESLAGIIAGRLREYYGKPSIVLADGEKAVKGSARSVDSYHMFKKLSEVRDLMLQFGGHPLAAGLSIRKENIGIFRKELNERCRLSDEDLVEKVWIDVPMPMEYVSESLIEELESLEPFGQGNERPVFAERNLFIREARVLGKNRNVVRLTLAEPSGHVCAAVVFTDGDGFLKERNGRMRMDMIYYPEINEYNGFRTIQAVVKKYRFREDEEPFPSGSGR